MYLNFSFIKTKDKVYLISDFPRSALFHESIRDFLEKTSEIFLLDTSDRFKKDSIKAFRMDTKDVLGCGYYMTLDEYSNDELEAIKRKGKLNEQPIYKVVD